MAFHLDSDSEGTLDSGDFNQTNTDSVLTLAVCTDVNDNIKSLITIKCNVKTRYSLDKVNLERNLVYY